LDPGETTGLCYIDLASPGQRPHVEQLRTDTPELYFVLTSAIADIFYAYVGERVLGMERFNFRHEERYRDKIVYTPAEVIGAVKHWWAAEAVNGEISIKLEMQMAAEGKGFWTDDKIKRLGLWTSSFSHAMDALRHALHYVTFTLKDHRFLHRLKPTTHRLSAPYDGTIGRISDQLLGTSEEQ
jgi:hypothetical protein